ncbi:MAG: hypothetical protein U0939_23465 [Pirellulales bacterium]
MNRVACPNCRKLLTYDDKHTGKTVACQTCGHSFALPRTPVAASPIPTSACTLSNVGNALGEPAEKCFFFFCEHCDCRIMGEQADVGLQGDCPHCGRTIIVKKHVDEVIHDPRDPNFDRLDAVGTLLTVGAGIAGGVAGVALCTVYFRLFINLAGPFPSAGSAIIAMGFYFVGGVVGGAVLVAAPFMVFHAMSSPTIRRKRRRKANRRKYPTKSIHLRAGP